MYFLSGVVLNGRSTVKVLDSRPILGGDGAGGLPQVAHSQETFGARYGDVCGHSANPVDITMGSPGLEPWPMLLGDCRPCFLTGMETALWPRG